MSITGTGIVFILLGLFGLIFNRKFLYDCFIFFIPFSATAIINIGSGDSGTAISPYLFLGPLWLISFCIYKIKTLSGFKGMNKAEISTILLLLGFAFIAFISLIMPVIINGSEMANVSGKLDTSDPIVFSTTNITQYIYLLFGIVMALALYLHNKDEDNYKHTIKIYAISILFVVFWGGIELFCYYKDITYPDFIFNNSISKYAGGFNGFLGEGGTKRISSVAVEPSILVQSVFIIVPFLLFGLIKKQYIFNKYMDGFYLLLLYIFIIRTTSTVGVICLCVISILSLFFYLKSLSLKKRLVFISLSVFIVPVVILAIYYLFQDIIDQTLFGKSDTYSSLERLSAVYEAWGTFLTHPVLGTGWGSVTSFDLFVKLLSNTGILGALFFSAFLLKVLINQAKAKNAFYNDSFIKSAICISFCTLIFSNMINGFSFVFGFFWLITGLIMVTGTNFYKKA